MQHSSGSGTARGAPEAILDDERAQVVFEAFRDLPYGISIGTADGYEVLWNTAYEQVFGSPPIPTLSLFDDPLLQQSDIGPQLERLRQGFVSLSPEIWYDPHELDPELPSRRRCVRGYGVPFLRADGQGVSFYLFAYEDMTERALAEADLRKQRSMLAQRVRELSCLCRATEVLAVGPHNERAILEAIVQLLPESLGPAQAARIALGGCRLATRDFLPSDRVLSQPLVVNGERLGEVSIALQKDEDPEDEAACGRVLQAVARLTGLALARLASMEAALNAERLAAAGAVAAGIVHDFGNTLAAITARAMVLAKGGANVDVAENAGAILEAAACAQSAVDRLRGVVRRASDHTEPVDLLALCRRLTDGLRCMAPTRIDVLLDAREPLPGILGDPVLIDNALLNLGKNAIEAMPEGGRLTIGLRHTTSPTEGDWRLGVAPDSGVEIVFQDTGVGMDEQTLARLFEPLFTTRPDRGIGMGLESVRYCVERHRGAADVWSTPGVGTEIRIMLPTEPAV
jgi:signal transduction histidine kinase